MSPIALADELSQVQSIRARQRTPFKKTNSVAVVLASRRPEDLSNVLSDLYHQSLPEFELHLGLHGFQADSALKLKLAKLKNRKVKVFLTSFDTSQTLGMILTNLAQSSSTRFVAKIDDDDLYGPEHLHDLVDSIITHKCEVVGRAMNYIYLEPIDLTVRRALGSGVSQFELFSDWVCGGTIMVERKAGEGALWFGSGKTAVDTHLLQGVTRNGGRIWRTFGTGYIYRRRQGDHTYSTNFAKYLNGSSEQWVGIPEVDQIGIDR